MLFDRLRVAAALSAALAIIAAAFGAHAMGGKAADLLRTGGQYQLIHAVGVFALAGTTRWRFSAWLMLGGAGLFALSLYALAVGAPHNVGVITPLGGGLMIGGWLCLAIKEIRNQR